MSILRECQLGVSEGVTVIDKPGEYLTRCGDVVVITEVGGNTNPVKRYQHLDCLGHYKESGVEDAWTHAGFVLPDSITLTRNDIVKAVD